MNKPIVKITCLILYLGLAGISCWATEQSLHLLLPSGWPEFIVWIITIAFFLVATYGTKLIVDSLSYSSFIDNRRLKLCGGIFLVITFWLLMSMPTNTHTFFYNDRIGSVVSKDIETTNKYLDQIIVKGESSGTAIAYDAKGKKIHDTVMSLYTHLDNQFKGLEPPHESGNGPLVAKYLEDINKELNSRITPDPRKNSKDPTILNRYRIEIFDALEKALRPHVLSETSVKAAKLQRLRLAALNDSIQNSLITTGLSEVEIRQCETELAEGYKLIKTNQEFIDFDTNSNDQSVYTQENAETRTKRMASVIEVFFVDFLQGKYPSSFLYFVLFSILVDISAFIVFKFIF